MDPYLSRSIPISRRDKGIGVDVQTRLWSKTSVVQRLVLFAAGRRVELFDHGPQRASAKEPIQLMRERSLKGIALGDPVSHTHMLSPWLSVKG